jgi:hypothetical protein
MISASPLALELDSTCQDLTPSLKREYIMYSQTMVLRGLHRSFSEFFFKDSVREKPRFSGAFLFRAGD